MDNLVVNVVIGLLFVFATFGLLVSTLTETVARYLGLRGEYLLRGIRTLVDGGGTFQLDDFKVRTLSGLKRTGQPTVEPNVTPIMQSSAISATADKGDMPADAGNADLTRRERRRLPSYVSSRNFARAFVDAVIPTAAGSTSVKDLEHAIRSMSDQRLKTVLLGFVQEADGDLTRFRRSLEHWYDDQMDRVSGWYKRHTRWISLALGAVLVLAFNVNAVGIARALYSDQAVRASVVTQAVNAARCDELPPGQPGDCLAQVRQEIGKARDAGLPIGWGRVPSCLADQNDCSGAEKYGLADPSSNGAADVWFVLSLLAGYALMVLSLVPGARFWFDLLSRLGSLRSTGPTPAP